MKATRLLGGLILAAQTLLPLAAQAQSVGIGTSSPAASAALDISSTGKGLLIPRLSQAQRTGIASPAPGLLVFQPDGAQPGFWYFVSPGGWTYLNPVGGGADNLGNHTATQALNLQGNALVGTGASIGTAVGVGVRADGGLNLGQNTAGKNVFVGYQAGQSNTTGFNNLFGGYQSGYNNMGGSLNQFSGYQSGYANTTGSCKLPLKVSQSKVEVRQLDETQWVLEN